MLISKKNPGFIIQFSTIAVDFWPRFKNSCITHYFLTHTHADHMEGLDSSWSDAVIYCSEITKKLLVNIHNINEHFIVSLEMNQPHIMQLDSEETFNVTLIDANHCPGGVMYLFEGYFGTILATGDFRYSPDMFIDGPLENKNIDVCYLDNTYLEPRFAGIPSRQEALNEIVQLIQVKRKEKSNLIFALIMKNLGKEEILVELARHFQTKIFVSTVRYERNVKILELNEAYFTTEFTNDVFIYAEDDDTCSIKTNKDKKVIYIKPSALEFVSTKRPQRLPVIIDLYSKSISTFYNIPYTDHSSYNELIEFVKILKPKRIVPIVPDIVEKNICNTDISVFENYLNKAEPLLNPNEKYLKILNSKTLVKSVNTKMNRENSESPRKLRSRHRVSDLVLHKKRYLPNRQARLHKTQIEYESSPEKSQSSQPRLLRSSARNREIVVNKLVKLSNDTEDKTTKTQFKSYNLRAKTFYEKKEVKKSSSSSSSTDSVCSTPNKSKWKKLNEQVEILENLIGANTSLNLEIESAKKKHNKRSVSTEDIVHKSNEGNADDSLITNDKSQQMRRSIRISNTQLTPNKEEDKRSDVSRLDISISSLEENNDLMTDKEEETRTGSKEKDIIANNKEAVIAPTDKQKQQLVEITNNKIPTKESIETNKIDEIDAFLNCFTSSINSILPNTNQNDYSDEFLTFLKNSFRY